MTLQKWAIFIMGGLWGNFSFLVGSSWNFASGYIKNVDTHHESFSSKKQVIKKLSPKSLWQAYMKWTVAHRKPCQSVLISSSGLIFILLITTRDVVLVLVIIKLTKFAVALRLRCSSCKLIFFILFHHFLLNLRTCT